MDKVEATEMARILSNTDYPPQYASNSAKEMGGKDSD